MSTALTVGVTHISFPALYTALEFVMLIMHIVSKVII